MSDLENRRRFLRAAAAAGAAWAARGLWEVEDALAWAERQVTAGSALSTTTLTGPEAFALDAMTSRILPSVDGRPGAREAGAVFFIDRALATFNTGQLKLYRKGIADVDRRARRRFKPALGFAALAAAQQDDVLREIEKTPFFATLRFDTIVGTFALPAWNGNREYAGWRMLGVDHQMTYQAPFGTYDAEGAL